MVRPDSSSLSVADARTACSLTLLMVIEGPGIHDAPAHHRTNERTLATVLFTDTANSTLQLVELATSAGTTFLRAITLSCAGNLNDSVAER
jgi:hypothetical protein